jgi:hypothetical protein
MTDRRPGDREDVATEEELRVIDEAIASLDAGEFATEAEIEAVFANFRSA